VIEPTLKLGPTLVAYCRLRQAERNFALARIVAVGPARG
jgi:predicted DNA-binding transcriptional regulator YafY